MDAEEFGRRLLDWTIEGILLVVAIIVIGNGLHIIPLNFGVALGGTMDLRMAVWVALSFPIIGYLAEQVQRAEWFSNKRGSPE
jgi:hypothetical protein